MRILLTGSTGLVGRRLSSFLVSKGHQVIPLTRKKEQGHVYWDPSQGIFNSADFENFDAIINLAGAPISRLWTPKVKEEIFQSRCRDSWLLAQILIKLKNPPQVLITASAIGYYGDRKEEILTESSEKGDGFLSDVCAQWERATASVSSRNVRDVHARFGIVLSKEGGMLKKLIPPFRWGFGTVLGDGHQYISWIDREDLIRALYFILQNTTLKGAVNCTSPHPETANAFSKKLANALHRPLLFHIPAFLLRFFLKEMADEMLLSSTRALPEKLKESGFTFDYPKLEDSFKQLLVR